MKHTPTHIPIQHSQTTSHKREAYKSKTKETKQQKISYPRVKQCEGKKVKQQKSYPICLRQKQANKPRHDLFITVCKLSVQCGNSNQREQKRTKTKHKLATSQIHTYPKYLFLTHTHKTDTLHSDTNKTSHFQRHYTFNHNVRACIIQRRKERENLLWSY